MAVKGKIGPCRWSAIGLGIRHEMGVGGFLMENRKESEDCLSVPQATMASGFTVIVCFYALGS